MALRQVLRSYGSSLLRLGGGAPSAAGFYGAGSLRRMSAAAGDEGEKGEAPAAAGLGGWLLKAPAAAASAAEAAAEEITEESSTPAVSPPPKRLVEVRALAEPEREPPAPPRRANIIRGGVVSKGGAALKAVAMTLADAVAGVKAGAAAKFDETVDIAVRLGIDPRRSDMIVRGVANLPHGTGKKIRVCVFAEGVHADEARAAGADVVGGEELINEIKTLGAGAIDFDKAVAHPDMMPKLSAIARVLGPRGLMPNPKVGTVSSDIKGAVASFRLGRVEFRAEKNAIVHAIVGKASFDQKHLEENISAIMATIMDLRPKLIKGAPSATNYLKGATISSTMGKGSFKIIKEDLLAPVVKL
eukprot:CAMPEP_0197595012 /NCGR_PEP_ID=MMETSP1326-20131121/21870_1 /TAXON_ID=1155430 /ORGANISM="Genus nov. species nov., Strain RCC2288" /LENGTH=357 /DNA_ID=CAMNT_0043161293 /DNA_START=169 /DNA_END=1242 /DNA_ORIENTATION=-